MFEAHLNRERWELLHSPSLHRPSLRAVGSLVQSRRPSRCFHSGTSPSVVGSARGCLKGRKQSHIWRSVECSMCSYCMIQIRLELALMGVRLLLGWAATACSLVLNEPTVKRRFQLIPCQCELMNFCKRQNVSAHSSVLKVDLPARCIVSFKDKLWSHPQPTMRSGVSDNLNLWQPTVISLVRSFVLHLTHVKIQIVVDHAILDEPVIGWKGRWQFHVRIRARAKHPLSFRFDFQLYWRLVANFVLGNAWKILSSEPIIP